MRLVLHEYVKEVEVSDYMKIRIEKDNMGTIKKLTIKLDDQLLSLLEESDMKRELSEARKIILEKEKQKSKVIDFSQFE